MSAFRYVLHRLLPAALTMVALSIAVFAATEVLPGDAVGVVAGPNATPAQLARVRAELGLDRPAVDRYLEWAGGALHGDLGRSLIGGRPVADILGDSLPNSLLLAGVVYALLIPLALLLGVTAGLRPGSVQDRLISGATLLGVGVPEFLTAGLLLALLTHTLGLVPGVAVVPLGGSALDAPETLVLPVLTLLLLSLAATTRLIRAAVAGILAAPYLETARLNGIRGRRLVLRHILPNTLAPAVQVLATGAGGLLGGAVVVETVFNYPGLGSALTTAVTLRDVPTLQGVALLLCAITLLALLLGDVCTRLLTPWAAS
ncbi:ABC transporter permease [Crossiella sp. SN42]|uniref:ABC transporter permease n=1 Tax=Crossiella sp. SN42 TaxID=2944808 RepID=UPI00207C7889|nr:ABC transporter permease [Crossiella sp. SN42]MCO1578860.1 ABC transporter permease [Crossiella sp. SN42]